jgi:hypothetical protein
LKAQLAARSKNSAKARERNPLWHLLSGFFHGRPNQGASVAELIDKLQGDSKMLLKR